MMDAAKAKELDKLGATLAAHFRDHKENMHIGDWWRTKIDADDLHRRNTMKTDILVTTLCNHFKIIEIDILISNKAAFAEIPAAASIISKWCTLVVGHSSSKIFPALRAGKRVMPSV
uniref:Uncharacterized protein n=1 Tax=Romanomermis culicivorax TaxID=13658 RepID=A0A915L266_ROMCU